MSDGSFYYHATSGELDPNCCSCEHRRSDHPTADAWEEYFAKMSTGHPVFEPGDDVQDECGMCSCTFYENPPLPINPMPKTQKEFIAMTAQPTADPMSELTSFVEDAVKNALTRAQAAATVANTTAQPAATAQLPVQGGVLVIGNRKNRSKEDWKALKEWAQKQSGYSKGNLVWGKQMPEVIEAIEGCLKGLPEAWDNGDEQTFRDTLTDLGDILAAMKKREAYRRAMAQ